MKEVMTDPEYAGKKSMMRWIKHCLAPPVFQDDENKTHRAKLLNDLLLTLLVLAVCLIAGNLVGGRVPVAVTGLDVIAIVLFLVLRHWNYQGRIDLAGGALMVIGLVIVTADIAILGTIRVPVTATYILLVVTAGLLFDIGGMIAIVALCSLAVAGLIVAENAGLLPHPDYTITITQWVTYTVLFLWAGSLTFSAIQYMRQALAHADKEITMRKMAEEAMASSAEFSNLLIECMQDGFSVLDTNGVHMEVNPALCSMTGFSREELIGVGMPHPYWPPEEYEPIKAAFQKTLKSETIDFELTFMHKNGVRFPVIVSPYAVKDKKGNILSYTATVKDITERKRSEEALQESKALLSNAFNNSPLLMTISDLSTGKYLEVNDSFCMASGFNRDEVIGKTSREIGWIEEEERKRMMYELQQSGKVSGLELTLKSKGGKKLICRYSGDIIQTAMGKKLFSTAEDITQSKSAQDMLKLHEIHLTDMLELHKLADATEKEIFDFTLEASLRAIQSDFAFIGLMTADETVMINQAWSKKVMPECKISEKPVEYPIAQAGLWGEVIRQRRPIMINDYNSSKEFKKGYPRGHVPIKRLLCIPIFSGNRIVVVACAANKVSDYTESDASAFTSLIHEMWDIFEHRRKEEEVSKNKAMLLKAQEIGHVGSWEWDIVTNDLVWMPEIFKIYGLDPQKVQPKYDLVLNTMSPESKSEFLKAIDDALKIRKPFEMEYSLIRPDSSRSYVHTKGEVLFDSEGHPMTMFGMVQDITERKRTEDELRKSEERYRKLIETEPECVKLLTKDSILIDMNPAGLGMIEADSREQVIGQSVIGIVDPEYREAFVDSVKRVFNGESAILEFSITGLKGSKRWLETHAVPMRDENGKINLLLSITRDITERKIAQEERITLIAREQAALAEAESARKLDSLKSMFLASTSHELRTPLNSIIGFTSLILDGTSGELTPDQKEQLTIVHSSGKHLLSLINDIIDLSIIESDKIMATVSEFNLKQIVDEAATNLNIIQNEKKLELKVDVSDIKMKSDRTRLLQCLINLISNAIKFTEKGSVEITAKVIDKNVEILIKDTGIGIKTEDIPRLFGPFVRLQTPLTFKTSGTGLGLYLVKKIAEKVLNGEVKVESEFGMGSKFTLCIPIELELTV